MGRQFNNLPLEDGAACVVCHVPFQRPYDRQPQFESLTTAVLKCPECGAFTEFWDPRYPRTSHRMREPGED